MIDFKCTDAECEFIDSLRRSLEPAALAEFREPERICLIHAMRQVGMNTYPPPRGSCNGEIQETGCLCEQCGKPNTHHPMDWRVIGYGNVPFLNVLCDGSRVKL